MAQFQTIAGGPTAALKGHVAFNSTSDKLEWADGTKVIPVLSNDDHCVIGTNGTLANNIRLNRAANEVLQFLTADDTTAEGSLSADGVAQVSMRVEGYATGSLPATNAANGGRLLYDTTLKTLLFDNATALKTLATIDGAEVLSNKILTAPQINDTSADHQYIFGVSELVADRTVTLPLLTGDDEFVFKDHSVTLTNKTLTSPVLNTGVSGTAILDEDDMSSNSDTQLATQQSIKAYIDSGTIVMSNKTLTLPQINDTSADHQYIFGVNELAADRTITLPLLTGNDEFVFKDHAVTLTNKTLTSPVLNTGVSGTAIKDEDSMASDSATHLCTQQSIKAYVDSKTGSVNYQLSNNCGDVYTSNTSAVDITNLSVTITTLGNPVMVGLVNVGTTVGRIYAYSSTSIADAIFQILRGTTKISCSHVESLATGATSIQMSIPAGALMSIDVIGAGTYTYKAQYFVTNASYTARATNVRLFAWEMK